VITRRVVGRPMEVLEVVRELPRSLRAVYEAGRTNPPAERLARVLAVRTTGT
jgi:hypothetical protein